jgi:hypothetical protein
MFIKNKSGKTVSDISREKGFTSLNKYLAYKVEYSNHSNYMNKHPAME